MAKEELIKEQNKAAMEQHKEERATQTADIQALAEERTEGNYAASREDDERSLKRVNGSNQHGEKTNDDQNK
jgi:hypothetical protein